MKDTNIKPFMLRREHKWEGEVEEESKDSEYD
jgi:hypothetical protein